MKLHQDGTIEGTPEEIMKYQMLKPIGVKPLDATTSIRSPLSGTVTYPGDGPKYAQQISNDVNAKTTAL